MNDRLPPLAAAGARRIETLDLLRGTALLAMASYHFTWDLEFFGYVARGLTGAGAWRIYARCIASSFLFLAGISLVLAHGRGIRWRPFWMRFLQVAGGAAVITLVTSIATPTGFVFFGILHEIALASLLGLLALRLPWLVTAFLGACVLALPWLFQTPWTEPKWLAWIGLADRPPVSNDYVPLFPWFGAVLMGIAAARLAERFGLWDRLRRIEPPRLPRPLGWLGRLGRHSLLFYLLHQPVLIGLVWLAATIAPPDPAIQLKADCHRGCIANEDEAFCSRYCDCVITRLRSENLLKALIDGTTTLDENAAVQNMILECSASPR